MYSLKEVKRWVTSVLSLKDEETENIFRSFEANYGDDIVFNGLLTTSDKSKMCGMISEVDVQYADKKGKVYAVHEHEIMLAHPLLINGMTFKRSNIECDFVKKNSNPSFDHHKDLIIIKRETEVSSATKGNRKSIFNIYVYKALAKNTITRNFYFKLSKKKKLIKVK